MIYGAEILTDKCRNFCDLNSQEEYHKFGGVGAISFSLVLLNPCFYPG